MMTKPGFFSNSSELAMIVFATGILLILFIPIPPGMLDLLLITNFSWALTILLLTFYTDKPLSFSFGLERIRNTSYFVRWRCGSCDWSHWTIRDS